MTSTYDYRTGRVELDFHLVKSGGVCKRSEIPRRIGNSFCAKCSFYVGERGGFTMCKFHKEDDVDAFWVRYEIAEEVKHQALCALCY